MFFNWFSNNDQTSNFGKINIVGVELLHADRQTDITKLIVTYRNSTDAPKNKVSFFLSGTINTDKCLPTSYRIDFSL